MVANVERAMLILVLAVGVGSALGSNSRLWQSVEIAGIVGGCNVEGTNHCPNSNSDCDWTACKRNSSGDFYCPSGATDEEQVMTDYDDCASSSTDEGNEECEEETPITCIRVRDCKIGAGGCAYSSDDEGMVCVDGTGQWETKSSRTPSNPAGDACNDG